jgi:hypothetical protein
MNRIAALLAAVSLSACSFIASRPPQRSRPPRSCSEYAAPPVLDTIQAITAGLLSMAAYVTREDDGRFGDDDSSFASLGGPLLAVSAVHGVSAAYGIHQRDVCNRLVRERPPILIVPPVQPESWPPEVEQHVDVDENQIDVHTTIRRAPPPR